ncbi:putative transcription factor interactor and regulator CCHC(Zn) family [Helianthus anomalus]
MEMITLRLKKFQDKTGKRLSLGKAGIDKSKLRCYNWKNLGHFKIDCPLLKNEDIEADPLRRWIYIDRNENATTNNAKALVVEDYDWTEEIVEAKDNVNRALMEKISTGSAPRLSNFLSNKNACILRGDEYAEKGLKSIANTTKPTAEKGKE